MCIVLRYKIDASSCYNGRIKSTTSFHIVSSLLDRYRKNDRALNRRVIWHSNVTLTSTRATEPSSFAKASHISSRGVSQPALLIDNSIFILYTSSKTASIVINPTVHGNGIVYYILNIIPRKFLFFFLLWLLFLHLYTCINIALYLEHLFTILILNFDYFM